MALSQMLYSMENGQVLEVGELRNEKELENLLCANIDLLDPNWLVIGQQIVTRNGKVLDLLCIDRGYHLIVLELKKDLTPREVTAQVIEYASYISELGYTDLENYYHSFVEKHPGLPEQLGDAFRGKFGTELDDSQIDFIARMVIVAARMDDGTEHIVHYLRNQYKVDINILFFQIFKLGQERILSRVWFEENVDIDVASEYNANWNKEYYISFGEADSRMWQDARTYGFISAGGGKWYTQTLKMLHEGDRIWVNVPHTGYVGVGIVRGCVQQACEAGWEINGTYTSMKDMQLAGCYFYSDDDPERAEFVVPVTWIKTVPLEKAVREPGFFGNQNTVCRPTSPKWDLTVSRLKQRWNIHDQHSR